MKRRIKNVSVLLVVLLLSLLTACNNSKNVTSDTSSDHPTTAGSAAPTEALITEAPEEQAVTPTEAQSEEATESNNGTKRATLVKPFDDIRGFETVKTFQEGDFNPLDIITFTYNKGTVLKGREKLQEEIMNNGMNPGLGIRKLHEEGITGKGVNVAIIDQNLLLHHPEFDGKIAAYYDTGCEQSKDSGSMHAPAVTSILVGNNIGVAPDAKVYFAAAPSWLRDSEYYAKGLYWIIEENKKLSEDQKIRVVSVSAAPSGPGSPFTENLKKWDKALLAAKREGILVLDCRVGEKTGIILPAFYDPENPEDVSMCTGGFPTSPNMLPASGIGVPTSYRTVAEEYVEGTPSYQYTGQGGLSWGIPYATGVLALGWQINPDLDNDKIIQMLFDTCTTAKDGSKIINPAGFIEAVKKTVKQ